MEQEDLKRIQMKLPFLQDAEDKLLQEFSRLVRIQMIPAGTTVFWEGDVCHSLAVLLSGSVRVFKAGENGREITLYRFGPGGGCILTASCIMNDGNFPAIAQVEEEAEAVIIPANVLRDWVNRFYSWRQFVLGLLAQRLADVITTVEEIAFRRMDARLAEWLLANRTQESRFVQTTHHKIAEELGTAREVISRLLKDFEMEGLILLSRGEIEIHAPEKLKLKMK